MFSQIRLSTTVLLLGSLGGIGALAQDANPAPQAAPQTTTSGGWRTFGTSPNDPPSSQVSGSQAGPQFGPAPASAAPAPVDPPAQLTIPAGTWISVRNDQRLSSDHNQAGDTFTATLAQPLVANGFVVARRGQILSGRVVEAEKAGKVKGTSHLGLELTDIALVDGQQLPVRTQLIQYSGGTSQGRDASAIGTTTALGAAVGAAADGGFGAGVGAAAGAAASTIGVLLTRGRATEIYPETTLTFRTTEPVTVATNQAFQPVQQGDYGQAAPPRPTLRVRPRPVYAPYPYLYGPGFYGPSFGVVIRGGRRW